MKLPKKGDKIYIHTELYLSHGVDDIQGGLVTVSKVEVKEYPSNTAVMVHVKEFPGHSWNWKFLGPRQGRLKKRFGRRKARRDPDYRPEFNRFF
jgi:hypothetical protein